MEDELTQGLWGVEELASFLGVRKSRVYDQWPTWEAEGLKVCRVGRTLKFRPRDVDAWLDRNRSL